MGAISFMFLTPDSHNKSHAHPVFRCLQTWKSFIIAHQNQAFHTEFISNPTSICIYKENIFPYKGNALMNEDLCKKWQRGFKNSLQKRRRIARKAPLRNSGTPSLQQTHCTHHEPPKSNATFNQIYRIQRIQTHLKQT